MRKSQRGITGTDVLILLALAVGVLAVMLPKWRVADVMEREDAAMLVLSDLAQRTIAVRDSSPDVDDDGRREVRDFTAAEDAGLEKVEAGTYRGDGYYFALLLPGLDRHAVVAGSTAVPADHAEAGFAILAWPVDPGRSGMRAYLWTELDGVLRHAVDGYPYGGATRPPLPQRPLIAREADGTTALRLRNEFWVTPREMRGTEMRGTEMRGTEMRGTEMRGTKPSGDSNPSGGSRPTGDSR